MNMNTCFWQVEAAACLNMMKCDQNSHRRNSLTLETEEVLEENRSFISLGDVVDTGFLNGTIQVRDLTRLEVLESLSSSPPWLRGVHRIFLSVSVVCSVLVSSATFETFIILIILSNTISLALQTPGSTNETLESLEFAFLIIYSVEAALKMLAFSLQYFSNKWNCMDFLIVFTGWLEIIVNRGLNLSALRALRVLRPLKSISSIQGMRIIFKVLAQSIKPLVSSLIILMCFMVIFAIAALNLWMGVLKNRCMVLSSGTLLEESCGVEPCDDLQVCAKSISNPNYDITHFDNFLNSILLVFQFITLEGWSPIMHLLQDSYSFWSFIYFLPLLTIGSFFLMNLAIAVIKIKFNKIISDIKKKDKEQFCDEEIVTIVHRDVYNGVYSLREKNGNNPMPKQKKNATNLNEYRNAMDGFMIHRDKLAELCINLTLRQKIIRKDDVNIKFEVMNFLEKSSSSHDVMGTDPEDSPSILTFAPSKWHDDQHTQQAKEYNFEYEFTKNDDGPKYVHADISYKDMYFYQLEKSLDSNAAFSYISNTMSKDMHGTLTKGKWSGNEVARSYDDYTYLNQMDYRIWKGWFLYQQSRLILFHFVESRFFTSVMTVCVILNTIVLSLDHHGISKEMEEVLNQMNFVFTIIFIVEMTLKLYGLTIKGYFKDTLNIFDGAVVVMSIIELVFLSGNSTLSAFRTIRIFRTFRFLRIARLFRNLEYMSHLIEVIAKSIGISLYLALLLMIFICIFALLGMQLFGGQFDFPEGKPRTNFDNFHWSFIAIFQILSIEDWNSVLYNGIRAAGPASGLFFISWIFIGNFILLNLFIAILLESFSVQEFEAKKTKTMGKTMKTSQFRTIAPNRPTGKSLFLFTKVNSI